VLFSMSSKS